MNRRSFLGKTLVSIAFAVYLRWQTFTSEFSELPLAPTDEAPVDCEGGAIKFFVQLRNAKRAESQEMWDSAIRARRKHERGLIAAANVTAPQCLIKCERVGQLRKITFDALRASYV